MQLNKGTQQSLILVKEFLFYTLSQINTIWTPFILVLGEDDGDFSLLQIIIFLISLSTGP